MLLNAKLTFSPCSCVMGSAHHFTKINIRPTFNKNLSEYDQGKSQSHAADQPTAPRERAQDN